MRRRARLGGRGWALVPCAWCGAPVRRPATRLRAGRRAFCSRQCAAAHMSGSRHPLAREGSAPPQPASWHDIAEAVRRRDGYRCRWCGLPEWMNGRRLSVDHILPRRAFSSPEEASSPDNLASLCDSCHARKTATAERRWLLGDAIGLARYARLAGPGETA